MALAKMADVLDRPSDKKSIDVVFLGTKNFGLEQNKTNGVVAFLSDKKSDLDSLVVKRTGQVAL